MTNTADLYDEFGEDIQSVALQMQSFGAHAAFEGRIRTVRSFEDNALVKSILASPGEGDVLVVDGGGSLACALMGDRMAKIAADNGWVGLVINGAIRDRVVVSEIPVGVKALGTNPRKSAKKGSGETDVIVEFGGVTFRPGATLYSDEDGILVTR